MVDDCQCGISSVGIWSGIIYDCLIFTVWYVILSIFLLCDIHFTVCECQSGISSVGIWIVTVPDCLVFTVWYVICLFIDSV